MKDWGGTETPTVEQTAEIIGSGEDKLMEKFASLMKSLTPEQKNKPEYLVAAMEYGRHYQEQTFRLENNVTTPEAARTQVIAALQLFVEKLEKMVE